MFKLRFEIQTNRQTDRQTDRQIYMLYSSSGFPCVGVRLIYWSLRSTATFVNLVPVACWPFLSIFLPRLPFSDLSSYSPPILAVVILVFWNLLASLSRLFSVVYHLSFGPPPRYTTFFTWLMSFSSNLMFRRSSSSLCFPTHITSVLSRFIFRPCFLKLNFSQYIHRYTPITLLLLLVCPTDNVCQMG